jgi:hypothetical protein
VGGDGVGDTADVDALVVHGDGHQVGAAGPEHVDRPAEARGLHHHGVARPDGQQRGQADRLLRTGGDQDVLGLGRGPLVGQALRQGFAQGGQAGREVAVVGEEFLGVLGVHGGQRLAHQRVGGEDGAGQRDHVARVVDE